MTGSGWEHAENRADAAEIHAHLVRCDARFVPPLSGRVDLHAYAHRLHARACRFEAWSDGVLIGLVAAYLDDQDGAAFVSNISVESAFLRQGVATALLVKAIAAANAAGRRKVRLRVGADNVAAQRLYEKLGFRASASEGGQILMQLNVPGTIQ